MNIFVTHPDPRISAQVLPDKHVVKMPLECCQMLAIIYSGWYYDWEPLPKKDGGYYATAKGAFRNHPCTKWARASRDNFKWLLSHMSWLYTQKSGSHKSANLIPLFQQYADSGEFPREDLTPFANCARNLERQVDHSWKEDVHQAYRDYMVDRWKERNITLTWKWGEEPEWR